MHLRPTANALFRTRHKKTPLGTEELLPIPFSVIFLIGAAIGFITPPFGLKLFVASGVTGIAYSKRVRPAMVYLGGLLIVWFLTAFVHWFWLVLLPKLG